MSSPQMMTMLGLCCAVAGGLATDTAAIDASRPSQILPIGLMVHFLQICRGGLTGHSPVSAILSETDSGALLSLGAVRTARACWGPMSAPGQTRTCCNFRSRSALAPRPDIGECDGHVRIVP